MRRSKGWFYIQAKNFNLFLVGKWFLKFLSPVLLAFKLQKFLILIIVCLLALDFTVLVRIWLCWLHRLHLLKMHRLAHTNIIKVFTRKHLGSVALKDVVAWGAGR